MFSRTAISGPARRNFAFYTRVLGLRLVKKTVNFDDPGTYHLYYGDEAGQPGQQDVRMGDVSGGNADDQARGRDNSVVGSKNCRSQPPDAVDELFLVVTVVGTAHGCFRKASEPRWLMYPGGK